MEWQPIETAPKDDNILVARFDEDGSYWISAASWWVECWVFSYHHDRHGRYPITLCFEPTHWQPLPEAPSGEGS